MVKYRGCCIVGTLPDQDSSNLAASVPASVESSLRADVPNVKKKHRRIKSTSRGSDPYVDAGKYQFPLHLLDFGSLALCCRKLMISYAFCDDV